MISVREGDLFVSVNYGDGHEALVHQCNCETCSAKGLAAEVFRAFPLADTYSGRRCPSAPGTADVRPPVINLYGQRGPGRPRDGDTATQRLQWFKSALQSALAQLPDTVRVLNVPWKIGCGLGGGDWAEYLAVLGDFAELARRHGVAVVLWRRAEDASKSDGRYEWH